MRTSPTLDMVVDRYGSPVDIAPATLEKFIEYGTLELGILNDAP